jgi:hypothetical protein
MLGILYTPGTFGIVKFDVDIFLQSKNVQVLRLGFFTVQSTVKKKRSGACTFGA